MLVRNITHTGNVATHLQCGDVFNDHLIKIIYRWTNCTVIGRSMEVVLCDWFLSTWQIAENSTIYHDWNRSTFGKVRWHLVDCRRRPTMRSVGCFCVIVYKMCCFEWRCSVVVAVDHLLLYRRWPRDPFSLSLSVHLSVCLCCYVAGCFDWCQSQGRRSLWTMSCPAAALINDWLLCQYVQYRRLLASVVQWWTDWQIPDHHHRYTKLMYVAESSAHERLVMRQLSDKRRHRRLVTPAVANEFVRPWPPSNNYNGSLSPRELVKPKRHLDRFRRFRSAYACNQHRRRSVAIGRIYALCV